VLGLPWFTSFLQVLHQVFAALRSSFSPERRSYAQKRSSDEKFRVLKVEKTKSLNL
jgi:hypothetical protein